jgi:hypothetical protein
VQTWQAAPLAPHAELVSEGVMQVPLTAQHPLQLADEQAGAAVLQVPCALQVCEELQTAQATPARPHAPRAVPPWQTSFASQQPEHLAGLQPVTWLGAHAKPNSEQPNTATPSHR